MAVEALAIETGVGLLGLGAGLAIMGGAIGTGLAQAGIGSAGMGVLAEKPEEIGKVLFFLVIPETLVIFGFVIAIILILGGSLI